jgi:hypothetical protein
MSSIDLHSQIFCYNALSNATIATNTTTVGAIIDTAGYESCEFIIKSGTRTDGTYTPLIQDGDDSGLSDAAAVSDTFLVGTEAAAAITASNALGRIGYVGKKRYVRLSIVSTSVTSGCTAFGAVAVLGNARTQPTTNN